MPCLTIDTGGVRSLVNDGVDGCLFDPEVSATEIAERLRPILTDPDRLSQMRQMARRGYETQWNWPTQCKLVLERMEALQQNQSYAKAALP